MALNRRELLQWMGGACSALALSRFAKAQAAQGGNFLRTRSFSPGLQDSGVVPRREVRHLVSLGAAIGHRVRRLVRPQYVPAGIEAVPYHVETYGHPSKVGYKDLVDNWKAAKWDPDHLMGLYKKAGAKYFVSMGVHHDNFDLWDSKYTRWNAVNMGPKKDIVGMWQKAARKQGLRFGVSEHLWISYKWFSVATAPTRPARWPAFPTTAPIRSSRTSTTMPIAPVRDKLDWNDDDIPDSWKLHYLDRMTDLIDKYQPDLLYTDGHLPFEDIGLKMVAHLYNVSAQKHGGQTEAVYTSKEATIAPSAPACSITSAAFPTASPPTPGKPTPASVSGITTAERNTSRQEGDRPAHRHREQER
jgi:hypothetical protein